MEKEALLEYGKRMLERGDRWSSIIGYLNAQQTSPELKSEIIQELETHEKILALDKTRKSKSNLDFSIIFGFLLIGGGIAMIIILWDMGWISTLPFIIIGAAIWHMAKNKRRPSL